MMPPDNARSHAHVIESEIHGGGAKARAIYLIADWYSFLTTSITTSTNGRRRLSHGKITPVLRPNLSHHDGLAGDY
jgi:hypothetical protein